MSPSTRTTRSPRPFPRTIARASRPLLPLAALAAVVALAASHAAPSQDERRETGAPPQIVEDVEVRRVQVDLSITRKDSLRSVPGIELRHLDIRLDGRPVDDDVRRRASLDYICDAQDSDADLAPETALPPGLPPDLALRPVLVLVDFNYLDAFGRHQVARALDDLAAEASEGPFRYKVYGYARQLRLLSPGFTRSAEDLAGVAQRVREVAWRVKPVHGEDELWIEAVEDSEEPSKTFSDPDIPTAEGLEVGGPEKRSSLGAAARAPNAPIEDIGSSGGHILQEIRYSETFGDSASPYRAISSIGAIESVMRAHAAIPGRKVVVLFSSEAFTFADSSRPEPETRGIRELARRGFTIWTVDVEGISRQGSGILLSSLARETGGRSVRRTGRLSLAFDGAREQVSCYYLLSLPLAAAPSGTSRKGLIVKVDTDRFPELWGLRVASPSEVIMLDAGARQREAHIAALLSPDDFDAIPVTASIGYPLPGADGEDAILPVRVRVPLGSLTWRAQESGVVARLLVDAVVERDSGGGRRVLRSIGRDEHGTLIDVRLPRPPSPDEDVGLQLELSSRYDVDGLLTARAAVTDLASGLTGGGRSIVYVQRDGKKEWQVHAPRVETLPYRVGLRDVLWVSSGEGIGRDVTRDTSGTSWRPVTAAVPARVGDHLSLYHVVCGPDAARLADALRYAVLRRNDGGSGGIELWLGRDAVELADAAPDEPFCSAASARLEAAVLHEAGEYAFAVVTAEEARSPDLAARLLERLAAPRRDEAGDGILALAPFDLR